MQVVVAGGGKVGGYLASLLLDGGYRVKVIEQRPDRIARLGEKLPVGTVVHGDATNPATLETAGIHRADVLAAVTGLDETNLIVTNLARFHFRVPRIIARVNNPHNTWMFTPEMGVDVPVNQAELMSHLIVEEMSLGDMMTLLKLRRGQYSLVEEKVHPRAPVVGKRLDEMGLPPKCILVAVIRRGDLIIPQADTVLDANDEVLAMVHRSSVQDLAKVLGRG